MRDAIQLLVPLEIDGLPALSAAEYQRIIGRRAHKEDGEFGVLWLQTFGSAGDLVVPQSYFEVMQTIRKIIDIAKIMYGNPIVEREDMISLDIHYHKEITDNFKVENIRSFKPTFLLKLNRLGVTKLDNAMLSYTSMREIRFNIKLLETAE